MKDKIFLEKLERKNFENYVSDAFLVKCIDTVKNYLNNPERIPAYLPSMYEVRRYAKEKYGIER